MFDVERSMFVSWSSAARINRPVRMTTTVVPELIGVGMPRYRGTPPSEPDRRLSRIRLSSRGSYRRAD